MSSNQKAKKNNFWIKNSILKNGIDLFKNDLVIFSNNKICSPKI